MVFVSGVGVRHCQCYAFPESKPCCGRSLEKVSGALRGWQGQGQVYLTKTAFGGFIAGSGFQYGEEEDEVLSRRQALLLLEKFEITGKSILSQ